jgi:hypothetical protein
MRHRWLGTVSAVLLVGALPTRPVAQTEPGSASATPTADRLYARVAILHPRDGHTVDFEAGYIRHLAWHQQVRDTWVWYGWTVTFGERQRWFIYATFGHSAASLDSPVVPAEDERDNIINVAPHVDFWGNALYEYRPKISRGTGVPQPAARLELMTVDLKPGAEEAFEAALSAGQSTRRGETLWYRMVAGGAAPRYVRLCPRSSLSAVLEGTNGQALPERVSPLIARATVEILTLRPTMSYGLGSPPRE